MVRIPVIKNPILSQVWKEAKLTVKNEKVKLWAGL